MGGEKLRPSWGPVKDALSDLKRDIDKVLRDGADKDGTLSHGNRMLAEQALNEIDAVVTLIGPCPQGLSPYRK